jgi:hypothetical protein
MTGLESRRAPAGSPEPEPEHDSRERKNAVVMFARSRIPTVVMVASVVFVASLGARVTPASPATPATFRWLVPAPAPSGWKHRSLSSGGATLAYPTSLAPIRGDIGSVTVQRKDSSGRVLVYLNATPRQGSETLTNWPTFRMAHNRAEDKTVQEDARAVGLPFYGGVGSCVIDHYITKFHANHYREIACFVQGRTAASVIVAAALESEWPRAVALLEHAVSAYRPS